MSEVTLLLKAAKAGNPSANERLWEVVYNELRRMAGEMMTREQREVTLSGTALLHEAWLRLTGPEGATLEWDSRGHFFSAAAEAMRRILVENARRKRRVKHGGELEREEVDLIDIEAAEPREDLIALDAALDRLIQVDRTAAELVQLRYFAGLTIAESAAAMDISPRTADRTWAFAKAWLHRELTG